MPQKTRIQLRRGVLADLPTLAEGEPGFTTDTHALYIGDGSSNHLINTLPDLNILINGGFDFFQRQNPLAWTSIYERVSGSYPSSRKFAADRWAVQINETATDGTKVEARRYDEYLTNDDPGRPKVLALRRSATGKIAAYQIIEGVNSTPLRGHSVTFQCRLRAYANNQYVRLGVASWIGTPDQIPAQAILPDTTWSANPALAPYLNWVANSPSINVPTDSWVDVFLTADLSAEEDLNNIVLFIYNSSYTSAAYDVLYISQAALHEGTQPRLWLPRPTSAELALCQRYCQRISNAYGDGGVGPRLPGVAFTANILYIYIPLKVTMYATPTATFYRSNVNATGDGVWDYYLAGWNDATSMAISAWSSNEAVLINLTKNGAFTAGVTYLTEGNVTLTAEL